MGRDTEPVKLALLLSLFENIDNHVKDPVADHQHRGPEFLALAPRRADRPPDVQHISFVGLQPVVYRFGHTFFGELLFVFFGDFLRPGRKADVPVIPLAAGKLKSFAVKLTFVGDVSIEIVHAKLDGAVKYFGTVLRATFFIMTTMAAEADLRYHQTCLAKPTVAHLRIVIEYL